MRIYIHIYYYTHNYVTVSRKIRLNEGVGKIFFLPTGTLMIESSKFETYSKHGCPMQFHFCMLCSFITTEK